MANDLILRQMAIDELKEFRKIYCDNTPESFSLLGHSDKSSVEAIDYAIDILVNLPSAESEIIRCKECKYYDGSPCEIVDWYNTADDFCSYAERRTDE